MSDTMPLNPTFDPDTGLGARGEYDATFTPTAPGDYTFHLTGNVHGTNVDQSFTSSDKTFDTVKDPTTIQFPAKVPAAADLSARIDRITPRLNDARSAAASAASAANSAHDAANRALVVGIIGVALAVLLGGANLAMAVLARRRPPV